MSDSGRGIARLLEERIEDLLARCRRQREQLAQDRNRIAELETELERRRQEIARLGAIAASSGEELDQAYLAAREKVRGRIAHLMARLESL